MTNNEKHYKFQGSTWGLLILLLIPILICEGCYEFFIALDDREDFTMVNLTLAEQPTTDKEWINVSVNFLKEIGWWQDDTILWRVSRTIDCSQADAPPNEIRLIFVREQRLSLLQSIDHRAYMNANAISRQVEYELVDGVSNFYAGEGPAKKYEELSFDEVTIDSRDAITIAEYSGGKLFRSQVGNECYVSANLSSQNGWEVDYEGCLEFFIDPNTGVVMSMEEKPITYKSSKPVRCGP
jgi:hypothetical protein